MQFHFYCTVDLPADDDRSPHDVAVQLAAVPGVHVQQQSTNIGDCPDPRPYATQLAAITRELTLTARDGSATYGTRTQTSLGRMAARAEKLHTAFVERPCELCVAASKLDAYRARKQFLYEKAPVMMYSVDVELRICKASNAWLSASGYTRDEVIGQPIAEFYTATSRAKFTERRAHFEREGSSHGQPYEMIKKDGSIMHVQVAAMCIPDHHGDGEHIRIYLTDITPLRQSLADLAASEAKYHALFDQAGDGIYIIDPDSHRFLDANAMGYRRLGYTPEELCALRPIDIAAPGYEGNAERKWHLIKRAGHLHFEHAHRTKDGRVLPIEVNMRVITLGDGRQIVQSIVHDIGERHEREEARIRLEKAASLDQLAGGIAHDFNNILTVILGNLNLAQLFLEKPERAKNKLIEAEKAAEHAKKITLQLLTLSRGGAPAKQHVTDLPQLIRDATQFALLGSSVVCQYDLPEAIPAAELDPGQIEQVIHNLVLNAERAMGGHGTIHIRGDMINVSESSTLPLEPGEYVSIAVTDDGQGIAPADIPKIFDPYFSTTKGGSGLGLTTSYAIISRHGGHITVESEPGVGTTFVVYLPLGSRDCPLPSAHDTIAPRGRILVMDDDARIRQIAAEALTEDGFDVVTTTDGASAIRAFARARADDAPFSAVILDLVVPGGMGGIQAADEIRKIDPRAVLLISSGHVHDPVVTHYRQHGFAGVITKPYRIAELLSVIADHTRDTTDIPPPHPPTDGPHPHS